MQKDRALTLLRGAFSGGGEAGARAPWLDRRAAVPGLTAQLRKRLRNRGVTTPGSPGTEGETEPGMLDAIPMLESAGSDLEEALATDQRVTVAVRSGRFGSSPAETIRHAEARVTAARTRMGRAHARLSRDERLAIESAEAQLRRARRILTLAAEESARRRGVEERGGSTLELLERLYDQARGLEPRGALGPRIGISVTCLLAGALPTLVCILLGGVPPLSLLLLVASLALVATAYVRLRALRHALTALVGAAMVAGTVWLVFGLASLHGC